MLVESGFEATVAAAEAQRPDWFETTAGVIAFDAIRGDDVLVFPENNSRFLAAFASGGQRKVVFCQSPWLAHQGLGGRLSYADYGVTHIMAPSLSTVQFCARRFPGLKVGYTPFYIDGERFKFQPAKTLQIAVVPRKRMTEFGAIADLLRSLHPEFADVPWVPLHAVSETQVAEGMMRSAVYLSLARLEAHGMTLLEAMACGCVCSGFTGVFGGSDTSTAANGFWAAEDDIMGAVEQLAQAIRVARSGGDAHKQVIERALATARHYSRENSQKALVAFWQSLLG
jgi:hypothetical protein